MLRSISNRLRMINYYSARRPRTVWTRASDASLFLTLALSIPVALATEFSPLRDSQAFQHTVLLTRDPAPGSPLRGAVLPPDMPILNTTRPEHAAMATVTAEDRRSGRPLGSYVIHGQPRIELLQVMDRTLGQPGPVALDNPELRQALLEAFGEQELDEVVTRLQWSQDQPGRHWMALLANAFVLWIAMAIASSLLLWAAEVAWAFMDLGRRRRRHARRDQNCCAECGYDLKGLEFHERCPECGSLIS